MLFPEENAMGITAKELAKKLNLSAAAVSMALHDQPGVSTETRKRVKLAAGKYGYDLSRIQNRKAQGGSIDFLVYKKSGAIVGDTPFFSELTDGIADTCSHLGWKLRITYLYESDLESRDLYSFFSADCRGVLILGTEMVTEDLRPFLALQVPFVLLDSYFETFLCDTVLINNVQGAYLAARHLIARCKAQPGFLQSSFPINNFRERADGFYKAIREAGMSPSQCIVHELTPSLTGAYADMKAILARKDPLARCYFAENDYIAAGALRAFKEAGFRIPKDIAIVGFDNLPAGEVLDPPLTTINVPKRALGEEAVLRLVRRIENPNLPITKTEVAATLVDRYSC